MDICGGWRKIICGSLCFVKYLLLSSSGDLEILPFKKTHHVFKLRLPYLLDVNLDRQDIFRVNCNVNQESKANVSNFDKEKLSQFLDLT